MEESARFCVDGGNTAVHGQVGQERLDLGLTHLLGVLQSMKDDKAFDQWVYVRSVP